MKKGLKVLLICFICLVCLSILGSCMIVNYSFDYAKQQHEELNNMPLY